MADLVKFTDNRIDTKHTDVYLQNFIRRHTCVNDGAEFVAPGFKVNRPSDKYLIYGKDNHRVYDDKIGRREPIKEVDLNASDGTYDCIEYGVAAWVYDRDQSNVDSPIRLMEEKTAHIKETKERNRAYRVFQTAASTSLVPSSAIAAAWATPTTSTPVANILTGMAAIEKQIAMAPNSILMTYEVALAMIKSAEWKDYFKYTDSGFGNGLFNAISGLRQLGLEPKIASDRGVTSYEGCASDPDWETMLGDKVLIFKREPSPTTQSNCFMFSPFTKKDEVRKFYKDEERGWKITIQDEIDELLVNAYAGYILDNVL